MTQITTDTDLWRACRDGERDAFRRIVERYQGLITSITYNATGDIPISEDLAQDTFLQAWRKIGTLREPDKLAGWLCAIARNRVRDWLRRKHTDVGRQAVTLVDAVPSTRAASAPDAQAENADESALVWHAIESIPGDYREVLVLHYREQIETAQMAEALGISEAAVRQRLSRARAMVRREVAAIVERSLRRTRPSHAFTLAVMAALPAVTPKVATAAVGGGAAVKASGSLVSLAVLIGPIIGLLGGLVGSWVSIRNTDSTPERRLMLRLTLLTWLSVCIYLGALWLSSVFLRDHLSGPAYVVFEVMLLLVYAGLLIPIIVWGRRRQRLTRGSQGSPEMSDRLPIAWSKPGAIYGGIGGAIFGSIAWMVVLAMRAGDWAIAGLIAGTAFGLFMFGATSIKRRGPKAVRVVLHILASILALITAVVANTQLYTWLARIYDRPIEQVMADFPCWAMNMVILAVFIVVAALLQFLVSPGRRRGVNQPA